MSQKGAWAPCSHGHICMAGLYGLSPPSPSHLRRTAPAELGGETRRAVTMLLPGRDRWTLRRPSSPALDPMALRGLSWVEEETHQFVWRKACSLKADWGSAAETQPKALLFLPLLFHGDVSGAPGETIVKDTNITSYLSWGETFLSCSVIAYIKELCLRMIFPRRGPLYCC